MFVNIVPKHIINEYLICYKEKFDSKLKVGVYIIKDYLLVKRSFISF